MRPMITLSITSIITYFYLFSFQINLSFFNIEQLDINNFSNAYNRLFLTFISVPAIIMPNLATRLTWLLQKKEYKKSLRMIYGIIGLSIVYFFIYKLTVPIVFNILDPNNLYPGTIPLTHVLSFGILFYPIIQILSPLFIFFHKEKYELFVAIILAILGLGLQLTVIPDFGILGLAYVILITITMDFLLKGLLFSRIIIGLVRKKS